MEEQRSSEKEKTSRERGLLYRWQGYSCTVNPEKVLLPRPVCHAALGISHGVLLTEDGLVYSFGDLYWRHSSRSQALSPVLEGFVGGQRVLRVSAGSFHCAAITDDGVVHAWGENANGQCGVSDLSLVPSPTPVSIVDDETVPPERVWILDVACGAQHTLALSGKHEVWAWGTGCQLGLVTNVFPVQRAQKVEHLSGRYVLQIACGGFHSLALVRSLPPLKSSRQSSETCGQCRQPLYTVIDKDDHVIISNNHYCPLGVELTDEKQGQRSNQGSPALMAKTELSGPDQQVFTGLFEDFCPGQKALDGSCRDDAAKKETFHQEPAPVSVTDSSAALPKNLKRTKTKSSPYPDEQALKDYLRRMSDQSLSENFEAVPTEGSRPPSRQTSLKDRCRVDQHDKPMFPALAPLTIRDVTNLSDVAPVATQSSASSALSSQTGRDALPLGVSACDDSEVKDRAVSCQDSLTGGGGEEACDESQAKNQDSERKCLEANKSASLSDVRIEDTDGLGRRRSLPGLLSKGFPKKVGASTLTTSGVSKTENLFPSLYTEVWSWGRGQDGQLGHGDSLPRLQPLCIKSLSNKEIVKVVAGSNHTLALTAQCQVYSWGSNKLGQLGHMDSSTVPHLVKVSEGIRVWDVAAGQTHTLLLADGDCIQPILYYSGKQVQEGQDSHASTCTQTPTLLPFCMNLGYVSSVFAGGLNCLALADQNAMGFISTLHELASAERKLYCTLSRVKSQILRPLLSRESVSSCLGQTSMQLFQTVAGCFSRLCHLTGQHAISLNSFLQNSRDVKTLTILKKADIFLDTYKEYSVPLGNFLVMGGFQALVKPAQECFGKKLELAQKLLELKEKDASPSDLLLKLLYMPLQHLCDYGRVLLKMTACFDVSSVEYRRLQDGCLQYEVLAHLVSKQRKDAEATHSFWKNFSGKSLESLRKPSRRLVCESGNKDLTLQNSGRFSVNTFILFNDTLVHAQFSSHFIYPLATLWIEPVSDENVGLLGLKLTTPEESFIVLASSPLEKGKWLRAINQAVDHVLGLGQNGQVISPSGSQRAEPPVSRTATYTFTKEGRLKEATYNGRWLSGKPHGKGTLKWADGRVYCGTFKHGLEDGFGDYMMPNKTLNKFDRYKGHWKEGKMHGFGTYWYATGEVYEGSFQDHQRHGHGMMSSGRLASPSSSSVFVGHWLNDKKAGYGIYDDITKGEKYMGMWLEDQRQGSGVVVTQFGLYYEGAFSNNRMTGVGLLLCEDDTAFEGEFSEDWLLNGKGVMRMPNGDSFEGIFVGEWGSELKVVGTFLKPSLYETETEVKQSKTPQVGRYAVPAEQKWRAVFEECWSRLGCEFPGQGENDRAWENIAVILTSSRRKQTDSPQMLSRSQCKLLESLEVIPQHRGSVSAQAYDIIRRYLIKACDTPLHPLGWLLETLVTVYRMTYVGVGSNRRLLQQAVEEIQSYLRRIFQLVRFLFPGLPEEGGFIPESSEGAGSDSLSDSSQSDSTQQGWIVSSSSLLLPILLPRLYHPLFTLYSLEREREEELYWDCIVRLNRQPDLSLLTFLGVPQKFWPVSVSILGKEKEQVLPSTKDACFATAVETLQQISTAFIPADKLQVIQLTFEDVTQEVQTMLGQDFLWSMDDLFPVFLYVVVRAQIRNLGSEVSLIDDLMEPALQHGELGLMFTTLKACYYQIQHENTTCF
ncbi:alsin isoform X3 [Electrophorus electricus]|uniref:alsin isoform X3 n=1 Tax=Electrophorus electricus TaxID=8005 RepID=UPI0015D0AD54|nr:alsin isoform X3 [Electrophorus electricus]